MDQYANYLDTLSQPTYSQQPNTAYVFLSPESHPPSLSASPVSSEGSEAWVDEVLQYGFFGYDHSPAVPYSPYSSLASNYTTSPNTVTSLADMLVESAPFATVAPSATSALTLGDTSAYHLSDEIAELSISSPVSSPVYHTAGFSSSPSLVPILQPQPTPVCDPKALDSSINTEQPVIQPCSPSHAESSRDGSDYSPSGESEIDDENDPSYGRHSNRRKARSARTANAAHPYSKPAPKAKSSKRRSTRIEIPTPVPGLTNNSRGRCVPKRSHYEDESRPFWCSVEDCDKLFSRGEHLKRHITSIHTMERPYQCECKKVFSRRDNLFQHKQTKGCVDWYLNGVKQSGEANAKRANTSEDMNRFYLRGGGPSVVL